jgi:hypothetical protein
MQWQGGGAGLAAGCFWCEEETWHIFGNFVFAVMPFELQLRHFICSCDIALQFCHLSVLFLCRILQLC